MLVVRFGELPNKVQGQLLIFDSGHKLYIRKKTMNDARKRLGIEILNLTGLFACAKFHVLTRSTKLITRENDQQCTFENVDRQKSLPTACIVMNCFATLLRSARTPPSTFLFLPIHLSNSPGIWRSPFAQACYQAGKISKRAIETHASEYNRMHFH